MRVSLALLSLVLYLAPSAAWTSPMTAVQSVKARSSFRPSDAMLPPSFLDSGSSRPSSSLKTLPLQAFSTHTDYPTSRGVKQTITDSVKYVAEAAKRELDMTCGMLQSDYPVTIVLGTLSAISFGLARSSAPSLSEWSSLLLKSITWFFGYNYFFDIGNQISGVEEDKLNLASLSVKANRPIATGAMSLEGAGVRHSLSGLCYMALSWFCGGWGLSLCAALWMVSSQLYNFRGWDHHFATKNYCIMSTGSIALLLAARSIAGEAQLSPIPSILAAVWIGLCMDAQDFRDETGDRLSGRRTTSVLWGVDTARKAWCAVTTLATGSLCYAMRHSLSWLDAAIVGGVVALMARTLRNKTVEEDHNTYNGICLAGAAFFFRSAFWARSF